MKKESHFGANAFFSLMSQGDIPDESVVEVDGARYVVKKSVDVIVYDNKATLSCVHRLLSMHVEFNERIEVFPGNILRDKSWILYREE